MLTPGGIIDAIPVAAVQTRLRAEPPNGVLDEAGKHLRERGIEVARIDMFGKLLHRQCAAIVTIACSAIRVRFADRIETVTVDSVLAWLARARLASTAVTLRLEN